MAVTFVPDDDLSVLALSSHTDLVCLSLVLTWDAVQDKLRTPQHLVDDPSYAAANRAKDLRPAWRSIAGELQAQGGNAVANRIRGGLRGRQGVPYKQIVLDLCEHFEAALDANTSTVHAEEVLLSAALTRQRKSVDSARFRAAVREATNGLNIEGGEAESGDALLENLKDHRSAYIAVRTLQELGFPARKLDLGIGLALKVGLKAPSPLAVPAALFTLAATLPGAASSSAFNQFIEAGISLTYEAVLEVIRIRRKVLLNPLTAGDMQ